MKAELWATLGMLRLRVQFVGPSVGLRAGADLGERLLETFPSWGQDAPENFLEGSSLTEVRRLFQRCRRLREAASDLVASPASS